MPTAQMSAIEQQVIIHAPRSRVWKALTTPSEFSTWFRANVSATEFREGDRIDLVSTYPGHEGTAFFIQIDKIEPEHCFVWRWGPVKATAEDKLTTVTIELEEIPQGTRVKVTESGFDQFSLEQRAKAFEANTQGWKLQTQNLRNYAEQNR